MSIRQRFRWDEELQCLVEVPLDYRVPLRVPVVGDSHYDGLAATDGTPINSRRKHRDYMARNSLTTMDDFGSQWRSAAKAREERMTTGGDHARRRDQIARIIYEKDKP